MKGFVNLYKPIGMSSSHAVGKVKRALQLTTGEKQKVGHFGTLDPLACGVLPIAIGNATRLFDLSQEKVKVYQATFKFGIETDTLDGEGQITSQNDKVIQEHDVLNALSAFRGKIAQIPPAYSAKSVGGKRAYELAREGKSVDLRAKEVEIFDFKLIPSTGGKVILRDGEHTLDTNEFAFEIACSSGTYIRSLARDLAGTLDTVGYMSSLLRVQSGAFSLDDAVTVEEFEKNPLEHILPIGFALGKYAEFEIPQECEKHVMNGVAVHFDNLPQGVFQVKLSGEVVGIAKNEDNKQRFIVSI